MQTIKAMVALMVVTLWCGSAGAKGWFDPDLASVGVGTWISLNDNTAGSGKDSYFNTAKADLWFHVQKVKGYLAVPVQLTVEDYGDSARYAFYPADLSAYLGWQLGPIEPRIGIVAPLGYPVGNGRAWTGSNSIQLLTGFGYGIGKWMDDKLSIGGETVVRVVVSDTSSGSRYARGTTSGYVSLKAGYALNRSWRAAVELFPYFGAYTGTDWGSQPYESFGLLVLGGVSRDLTKKTSLAAKIGYGTSRSNDAANPSRQKVINAAVSTAIYLW